MWKLLVIYLALFHITFIEHQYIPDIAFDFFSLQKFTFKNEARIFSEIKVWTFTSSMT